MNYDQLHKSRMNNEGQLQILERRILYSRNFKNPCSTCISNLFVVIGRYRFLKKTQIRLDEYKNKALEKAFSEFLSPFPDCCWYEQTWWWVPLDQNNNHSGKDYLGPEVSAWLVCNKEWGLLWYWFKGEFLLLMSSMIAASNYSIELMFHVTRL